MTYTLLDSVTLASSAASVTFSAIDQSYGDLVLVSEIAIAASEGNFTLRFNGDSGNNYNGVTAEADKFSNITSVAYSNYNTFYEALNDGTLNSTRSLVTAQIMDYSATDKHKSVLFRAGNAGGNLGIVMTAGRWASTSAITALEVRAGGATINTGSTFHLYGIAKAL